MSEISSLKSSNFAGTCVALVIDIIFSFPRKYLSFIFLVSRLITFLRTCSLYLWTFLLFSLFRFCLQWRWFSVWCFQSISVNFISTSILKFFSYLSFMVPLVFLVLFSPFCTLAYGFNFCEGGIFLSFLELYQLNFHSPCCFTDLSWWLIWALFNKKNWGWTIAFCLNSGHLKIFSSASWQYFQYTLPAVYFSFYCYALFINADPLLGPFLYKFVCLFVCLFVYLWLCWVFIAVHGLSSLWWVGATLRCGAWASHCGGFFCCGAWALGMWASVVVARRL